MRSTTPLIEREKASSASRLRLDARGVPAGGEQRIAVAEVVGGARTHVGGAAGLGNDAAFGETFVKSALAVGRPAVVAKRAGFGKSVIGMLRIERGDGLGQMTFEPADALGGGGRGRGFGGGRRDGIGGCGVAGGRDVVRVHGTA